VIYNNALIASRRRSQRPAFLPNKSACQGRAFGAPRSGFTLDKLICSEAFAAVAIDGSLSDRRAVAIDVRNHFKLAAAWCTRLASITLSNDSWPW